MRSPSPRKQPYELLAMRATARGMVAVIHDRDENIYYVGVGLTIGNLKEGGPYGCRTYYDKEEALEQIDAWDV